MGKLLGGVMVDVISDLTKLPQNVASAMSTLENAEIVGASYKALIYLGRQVVKGVNYYFIAEQTLMTAGLDKHIVIIAVNEYQGEYKTVLANVIRIV